MKQLLSLFLFLLPCLALAQYPSNGNQKITLGEQTTADGLIYRGVLADTGIITPSSDTSAYIILDTINHRFYNYNRATNVWSATTIGSISSGLTGVLPVANGGTGSATQNFVDLTNTQTVNGAKTFSSTITGARFDPTSSSASGNGMFLQGTNTLGFSTNNSLKLLLTSSGNICTDSVSKTTVVWKTFELGKAQGTTVLAGRTDGSNQFILGTNWYYDGGTNQEYIGNGFSTQYYQVNGEHIMRTAASGSAGGNITFTDYLRISTVGESNIVNNTDQGAYNLQVGGTGVWAAGAYVNGSDINIKNNIENLDSSLNLINSLKPVTYKYNESFNSDEEYQIGFIAQDVYQNFENKKYVNSIVKSDGEILSMSYSALIPILTKAIQEQQALIKALEQRIINLENK
jgi:hypothetical protein